MTQSMAFFPLVPPFWLTVIGTISLILIIAGLILRRRGMMLRFLALVSLLLALANPSWIEEKRETLPTTLAVIIDRSPSQKLNGRTHDTDAALAALKNKLAQYPDIKPRYIESRRDTDAAQTSTRLFETLSKSMDDVPPARIAGAVLITDGEVHDIPDTVKKLGFDAPINALITGHSNEFDMSVQFIDPPRFGLAGKELTLTLLVEEKGRASNTSLIPVTISIDGKPEKVENLLAGTPQKITLTLPHAGKNIIEAAIPVEDGELTSTNNETVAIVDAVRENLRVLLVSGEPHNGERIWRDLLKSDTSVDLVHFTILRPPEKADNTPLNQMSLIVFPTTELFVEKINDFDLVIFDRYQHYDVLPLIYYDYIAQYIQNGGALLMATGPEFAGQTSLARTPLISALPVLPTGKVIEKAYTPELTMKGKRHPVTRGLEGAQSTPPHWGRWLRQIDIQSADNKTVLMKGADNKPLMLLDHVGKGRVGMLLSDEGWLWARGFEGGGPYAALYRRMAHWLMKEPELEEEALTATSVNNTLSIRRQTMADKAENAIVTTPSGQTQSLPLVKSEEGVFTATIKTDEIGLFHISNGDLKTLIHIGPVNAPEFNDMISTTEKLEPIAKATGGNIMRLHSKAASPLSVPDIRISNQKSNDAIMLKPASETRLISTSSLPIFNGALALLSILLLFCAMWYREGR